MAVTAGLQVVFGNGPVGSAATRALLERGLRVRLASRGGRGPAAFYDDLPPEAKGRLELLSADAMDPAAVERATDGATHVYHCVNVPYHQWASVHPPIQRNLVHAAITRGAVLGVAENLYTYARGVPVIGMDTPEDPPSRKGRLRKELHEALVRAGSERGLPFTAVRASDYYGPGAAMQSVFGTGLFLDPLFKSGRPAVLGNPDQPHSYAYVEDYGRALTTAALDPRGLGRTWIAPHAAACTTREAVGIFVRLSGRPAKLRTLGRLAVAMAGLFDPVVREVLEMLYQKEEPYIVDGSVFTRVFGLEATPLEEGVRRTLEWYAHTRAG